jgi:hypothetical protein
MNDFRFNEEAHPMAATANRILDEHRGPQHVNATPLLCRSKVRELALDVSKQLRPFNKFNRVSEETLIAANEAVRAFVVGHVKRMPSRGRTL